MLAEIKAQYLYPYTDQISGPPGGDAQTNAGHGAHVAAYSDGTTTIGPMRSPSVREAHFTATIAGTLQEPHLRFVYTA